MYFHPLSRRSATSRFQGIYHELHPTFTPLLLTVEEWGDAILAHFQKNRMTGAFIEGTNGLKALRGRLLYGLREGRDRKRVQTKESENGGCVDGPFLGTPLSTLLSQDQLVNGEAPSTLESR